MPPLRQFVKWLHSISMSAGIIIHDRSAHGSTWRSRSHSFAGEEDTRLRASATAILSQICRESSTLLCRFPTLPLPVSWWLSLACPLPFYPPSSPAPNR